MTTPNEELLKKVKRLRSELDDSNSRLDRQCVTAMYEMEQALQSQAERIKELEDYRAKYNETYEALDDAARENTTLRAQLAAIAASEPVGKVVSSGPANLPVFQWLSADHSLRCNIGDELFTRPMPAQGVTELVELLESIVAMEHTESNEWDAVERVIPEMCDTARDALSKYKEAK